MFLKINLFDSIFLISTLVITGIAYLRGFLKEILALINWIISITICYFLAPVISHALKATLVASIAIKSGVFLIFFILIAIIFHKLHKKLLPKFPDGLDSFLGGVLGIVKSFLIFGITYAIALNIYSLNPLSNKELPEVVTSAWFNSPIKTTAEIVQPVINRLINFSMSTSSKNNSKKLKAAIKKSVQEATDKAADDGYEMRDIEKKDRLIEIINKN